MHSIWHKRMILPITITITITTSHVAIASTLWLYPLSSRFLSLTPKSCNSNRKDHDGTEIRKAIARRSESKSAQDGTTSVNVNDERVQTQGGKNKNSYIPKFGAAVASGSAIREAYESFRMIERNVQSLAEKRVDQAVSEGLLENLKGKGKPLPYRPSLKIDETEAALNRMLKEQNITPDFIEVMHRIDAQTKRLRHNLRQAHGTERWEKVIKQAKEEIAEINKLVDGFNLSSPSMHLFRIRLQLQNEIDKIENEKKPRGDR